MVDYKKMYYLLCSAADAALAALESEETDKAAEILQKALLSAEDIYIDTAGCAENIV